MPEYTIPLNWLSVKEYKVEANTLQEAIIAALKLFMAEPDVHYLCDSVEIDNIVEDNYPEEEFDFQDALDNI